MKHPILLVLALALAIALWGFAKTSSAHHKRGHQSPPLGIIAIGRPVDCGKAYDHLMMLEKAWESDKNLIRKGIRSPIFKKDFIDLLDFRDFFLAADCRVL